MQYELQQRAAGGDSSGGYFSGLTVGLGGALALSIAICAAALCYSRQQLRARHGRRRRLTFAEVMANAMLRGGGPTQASKEAGSPVPVASPPTQLEVVVPGVGGGPRAYLHPRMPLFHVPTPEAVLQMALVCVSPLMVQAAAV